MPTPSAGMQSFPCRALFCGLHKIKTYLDWPSSLMRHTGGWGGVDLGHCAKVKTKPQMLSYKDGSHPFCVYNILASIRISSAHLKKLKMSKSATIIKQSLLRRNSSYWLCFSIALLLNRTTCWSGFSFQASEGKVLPCSNKYFFVPMRC